MKAELEAVTKGKLEEELAKEKEVQETMATKVSSLAGSFGKMAPNRRGSSSLLRDFGGCPVLDIARTHHERRQKRYHRYASNKGHGSREVFGIDTLIQGLIQGFGSFPINRSIIKGHIVSTAGSKGNLTWSRQIVRIAELT